MESRRKARWILAGVAGLGAVAAVVLSLQPREAAAVEYDDPTKLVDLSGMWLFRPGDNIAFARPGLDDLRWLERRVPADNIVWAERWAGNGWYRRHLNAGEMVPASNLMIAVGLAREAVEVYVNGSLVAARGELGTRLRGGASLLPLTGIIPAGLLKPGDNIIAVRIYDPAFTCGLVARPFLLGPPDSVRARLGGMRGWTLGVRIGLGLLAIFVCLAQLLSASRKRSAETPWLVAAGLTLAVAHLAGIGVFGWLPSVDFKARLPEVAIMLAILCLGSFFAIRYEDLGRRRVLIGQGILLAATAALVLMPAAWVFFAASPAIFLAGLIATLYSANLCAQAVRRGEPGSLPVFIGLGLLGLLAVYDGFVAAASDLLPPTAVMGAVLVLAVTAIVQARQMMREYYQNLQRMLRLNQRFEGAPWRSLIDACILPMLEPKSFFISVIQEISRELEVRRCSLVLNHTDGLLRIRASVGLPTHMVHQVMAADSISAYVFRTGKPVDSKNPTTSATPTRHSNYSTDAFMCYPVASGTKSFGVLNVSDRNDGGEFQLADVALFAELAHKLALACTILPAEAFERPPEPEPEPEAPKTEAPKTEAPKTEEPKTEEPKTEEPKTEEPKTEEPKTEEPPQPE